MTHKYVNITVSIIALSLILLVTVKYCGKKTYTQAEVDTLNTKHAVDQAEYMDSLDFVRGQLDLQQEKSNAQQDRMGDLEKQIDSLTAKHEITKAKLQPLSESFHLADTGFVLAPNEYVNECEGCFTLLGKYKKESGLLKFERDGFDSLLRMQNSINEDRVLQLEHERLQFNKMLNDCRLARAYGPTCDTTRKVKLSLMGMFGNPFLPKGGGFGLIYEDRKFNEYGGHVVFTGSGNVYLLNIAKTISFRRKK